VGTSAGVTVNVDAAPNAAAAGTDIEQCNDDTFVLSANTPAAGTTGTWTIENGTATLGDIHDPNMTITGVPAGTSVTLRWTISNGVCASTFDDVVVHNEMPPSDADAGVDISQCGNGAFTVTANNPVVGVGQWRVVAPDPGVA